MRANRPLAQNVIDRTIDRPPPGGKADILTDWASQETIDGYPRLIPALKRLVTHGALEAADFTFRNDALDAFVNSTAFTFSLICHMRPCEQFRPNTSRYSLKMSKPLSRQSADLKCAFGNLPSMVRWDHHRPDIGNYR